MTPRTRTLGSGSSRVSPGLIARLLALVLLLSSASANALDPHANGDFVHTPAAEQKVNTPLPVYVESPDASLGRVFVKYAGTGVKAWSRLEMKRIGAGWGALIPCGKVTAGAMRYWLQGYDENGEPSATSGDPKHPFIVPIRESLASKPPHLPGRAPPQTCAEDSGSATDGAETSHSRESQDDDRPSRGTSTSTSMTTSTSELAPAVTPASSRAFARWWVGVAGAVDFVTLPGGTDLCTLTPSGTPANASGYYCTNPNGSDFPPRTAAGPAVNASLIPGDAGQVTSRVVPGDLRAMLAVDYALSPSFLLGGRLGYVLNAYPASGSAVTDHRALGAKVHVEARATYLFGDDPLARVGFAPTVFGAVGISEFDGHAASIVSFTPGAGRLPINQPVNVWLTSGPWFLAAGGGARYQFSQRAALTMAVRLNAAFGAGGALFTFGPELAFQYGF